MKKFHYRLEPVLKIKSHFEKQRQKEHAAALQQVVVQKDRLTQIDSERNATIDYHRDRLVGQLRTSELLSASRYLVKLKRDTLSGAELLRGLEREAEIRRQRLVEATKQKKTHEKLKERKQKQFIDDLEMQGKKQLDEIAVNAYRLNHKQ